MLLSVKNMTVHYGKAMALDSVSLEIGAESVVSLIGANGAGKSTLLKALSGLTPLTSGEIWFNGQRIDGKAPYDIVKLGLAHIPEGRRLFPYLTVLNNLKLGASLRNDTAGINQDLEEAFEMFPILCRRSSQRAGTLSGGEQQMLAIARSLMSRPKLLLMDEPSVGLAPIIVNELAPIIRNIKAKGISVFLIEQNVPLALKAAKRAYAIQLGKIILEGEVEEFKNSEVVKRAYLGG